LFPCEANPNQWFSESPKAINAAKAACGHCPARNECAEVGESEEFGVWGGTSAEDRQNHRHFRVIMLQELTNNRIKEMHRDGVSISAMARELEMPRTTVAQRLRRLTGLAA
jgi:transcriptional regulator of acetoin/glycerol metabolism